MVEAERNSEMDENTQQANEEAGKDSGWESKITGTLDDGRVVTARNGTGGNEGQTIVGAGELSSSGLDAAHDHYGPDVSKENDHGNLDSAPDASEITKP